MEKLIANNDEFFANILDCLESGRRVTTPVKGGSMLPFIREDVDFVELEKAKEIKKGDIVLFNIGHWVLHRVIDIKDGVYTMRGDGVLKNCERTTLEHIHAKAVAIIRNGSKRIDPYSPTQMAMVHVWEFLRPVRRYILAIRRRLVRFAGRG